MQRLKIIQCFFSFEIGGAQILALELMNEMCKNHDVSLIVINDMWSKGLLDRLDKRIPVTLIKRKKGSPNPIPILKLNYLLFKSGADIVHCHEPKASGIIRTRRSKLVQTVHDTGISPEYYPRYDLLIAISDAVAKDVRSRCSLPVETIYNGIQMDSFRQRKNYNLGKDQTIRLVQVSRLMHEKKGHDILLRALHSIIYEYGFKEIMLDFMGSGESLEYLQKLVKELDLTAYVNFLGDTERSWLFEHLADYHILVQPSRYEGFGLTILEAFSAGIPVLASDIEGPAEIINGKPGGFLFKSEDVASCAKELFYVINIYKNDEFGQLMSQTLRLTREKYSMKTCAQEYLAAFCRLIQKKSARAVEALAGSNVG